LKVYEVSLKGMKKGEEDKERGKKISR